jgi:hypothetical protein
MATKLDVPLGSWRPAPRLATAAADLEPVDANSRAARFLSYLSLALGVFVGVLAVALRALQDRDPHLIMYAAPIAPIATALFFGRCWVRDARRARDR